MVVDYSPVLKKISRTKKIIVDLDNFCNNKYANLTPNLKYGNINPSRQKVCFNLIYIMNYLVDQRTRIPIDPDQYSLMWIA